MANKTAPPINGGSKRFWEFVNYKSNTADDKPKRELYIVGEIGSYAWWGDEITPSEFEKELYDGTGDVDIWINSPGGDVIAASEIYNSITQYTGGKVTAYIYGICASAATVITMAAKEVKISPTALMLIHNPSTSVWGDREAMQKTITQLEAVKESIINAYVKKTGLSREELSAYMDKEKAFDAMEAIELGFADGLIESEQDKFSTVAEAGASNFVAARFYNSVKDWTLAVQAVTGERPTKQEDGITMNTKDKTTTVENTTATTAATTTIENAATTENATVATTTVDVKDFKAVMEELKAYKEKTESEIKDLREYKARQEAEIKARDLVGLPGITDERRIELARTADDKLFSDLKAMAAAMNELVKPVGVTVREEDAVENKEENILRKKITDYAAEKGIDEVEAFHAVVVNGGK